ncbi:DUF892 family protein [Myroides sp. LJL110]
MTHTIDLKDDASRELDNLFTDSLRNLFSAKNAFLIELEKSNNLASSPNLKHAIQKEYNNIQLEIASLQRLFGFLNHNQKQNLPVNSFVFCAALQYMDNNVVQSPYLKDAQIIQFCNMILHYQIASYQSLLVYSDFLKKPKSSELLTQILDQKKLMQKCFSKLALSELFIAK